MTLILSFSDQGRQIEQKLLRLYPKAITRTGQSLTDFMQLYFERAERILFIGATGIAVRAIAPHIQSKASDPAVLVMDEAGQHVISLLSGHLGGANQWARELAESLGATAIITTASDLRQRFAIDDWAREQGFQVFNPGAILPVAKKCLAGQKLRLMLDIPWSGTLPDIFELVEANPDVRLSYQWHQADYLQLIAPVVRIGSGCRKGLDPREYAQMLDQFLASQSIPDQALAGLYSIELKAAESALIYYAFQKRIPFIVYDPADLMDEPVSQRSEFVARVTGIDNVCERCANYRAQPLIPKTILTGATVALGLQTVRLG